MKSIAIFCGASEGYNECYREAAYEAGEILAEKKIRIVYGGGRTGIMGAIAEGALHNGGNIIGVIPSFLKVKEVAHDRLSSMITVDTMHQRKMKIHELCDGIIALPGGWGTMEELFEMLTWGQLGLHQKPVGLYNINGYYDLLKTFSDNMVQEGFLDERINNNLLISDSFIDLLEQMNTYSPPALPHWITNQTT